MQDWIDNGRVVDAITAGSEELEVERLSGMREFVSPGSRLVVLDDDYIARYRILNRAEPVSGSKPTNPKVSVGSDKLPLHLWPTTATAMGSVALLEGAAKYGRTNWRQSGARASIYVDACKRHLDAWFEGEDVSPDSGVPHLANALACLAIIVDAKATGMLVDDRAFNGDGYRKLVEELTPHVNRIKSMHSSVEPRHYSIADNDNAPSSAFWGI